MEKKKSARRRGVLGGLVMAAAVAFLFAGCGGQQGGTAPGGQSAAPEPQAVDYSEELETVVLESMDAETREAISEITVREYNGEHTVIIRTYLMDALYFPAIIEQTAGPVFEKAEELGTVIGEYRVTEYTESTKEGIIGMIVWKSEDGVTGIYANDRVSEPYVIPGMTVEALREHLGIRNEVDFGDALDPYQGEWTIPERSRYHRLIISGDTVNFVSYEDLEQSEAVEEVTTFYFDLDSDGGLVVNNQHGLARYTVEIDDAGQLILNSRTGGEPETYEKVSDSTTVPKAAE